MGAAEVDEHHLAIVDHLVVLAVVQGGRSGAACYNRVEGVLADVLFGKLKIEGALQRALVDPRVGVAHHRLDGVLGGDLRDAHLFQFGFGLDDAHPGDVAEDVLNLDSRLLLLELVSQFMRQSRVLIGGVFPQVEPAGHAALAAVCADEGVDRRLEGVEVTDIFNAAEGGGLGGSHSAADPLGLHLIVGLDVEGLNIVAGVVLGQHQNHVGVVDAGHVVEVAVDREFISSVRRAHRRTTGKQDGRARTLLVAEKLLASLIVIDIHCRFLPI